MRKTKLPTSHKGGQRCKNCSALLIHSYNWDNKVSQWKCQGCGATRYEPAAKFEIRFQQADLIK